MRDTTRTWSVTLAAAAALTVAADSGAQPTLHPERWPELESPMEPDPAVESRIDALLGEMSTEARVGQVIQAEIRSITPEEIRKYHIGSVLNGGGGFPNDEKYSKVSDWLALADAFYDASVDTSDGQPAIPVIWGVDAVHGHNNVIGATLFPHNIGLGAANDPELLRRIGEVTAREVRATGLDWNFGPTVTVPRDDRWGRTYEGYSEDPEIVAAYAEAMVEGLQGAVGAAGHLDAYHVISTAKHFLADGGTEDGKDQGDARISEEELRDVHAQGYVTALQAGVQVVMASFSSWQGQRMHGNRGLLTDVLKGRMGFDGFVVGDWNAHGQVPGCSNQSCPEAFDAGIDMFMVPQDWKALYESTLRQVESGEISRERLDDAVRRILRVKIRAGLFERGRPGERPLAGDESVVGSEEHRAVARQAVRESLVLLKHEGKLLPLAPGGRVLVAGDGADDIGKQCGGWTISWQGTGNVRSDFPGASSVWDGIRRTVEAGGGLAVLSPDGSFDADRKPDVAIVVYGEDPYAEFQGDREILDYSPGDDGDLELLKRLRAAGIPVVSVFISGRPMWVNPELNASTAFVAAWLPGTEGDGVAEVLFRRPDGSVNHDFSGALSFSWPRSTAQLVLNRNDPDYDPLFPYGFGLTYADDVSLPSLSETVETSAASSGRLVYFDGEPVAPWKLYVGDAANPAVEVGGSLGTTQGSERLVVRSVDRRVQEDARSARWSGDGAARVFLAGAEPIDVSREANGALALAFDVRVDEPPSGTVALAMGCGEGCAGAVDVTELLKGLSVGEWTTLRVRLRRIEGAGADMARIVEPFSLSTPGVLALAFSEVRLVTEADGEIHLP
jgi:beta-glucosidase